MFTDGWENVLIQAPTALRLGGEKIPLSRLYDSGFFISAVFGTEAWVIDKETYETYNLQLFGDVPAELCIGMQKYNDKQYNKFLAKIEQLRQALRLSRRQSQFLYGPYTSQPGHRTQENILFRL
mgnify:CR=1 FL=1